MVGSGILRRCRWRQPAGDVSDGIAVSNSMDPEFRRKVAGNLPEVGIRVRVDTPGMRHPAMPPDPNGVSADKMLDGAAGSARTSAVGIAPS